MISKYRDHLSLYRLEQIVARDHVILPRATLAEWIGRVGVVLQPLVNRRTWHLRCMPTKRRWRNSTSAAANAAKPTCVHRSNDLAGDGTRLPTGRRGEHARQFFERVERSYDGR
ncbi:MAG: transposase [Methylobacter sp.]|nr:transposase [Methylobacter sp.]